jgi:hypothetical protein
LTFFFDNCLSPKVVRALRELGEDAKHLRDELPANTKDTDWIPIAASKGWVAVTSDLAMARVPVEVAALSRSGLIVFFMPRGFQAVDIWTQAHKLFKAWPEIKKHAAAAKVGEAFQVSMKNCKVERKKLKG